MLRGIAAALCLVAGVRAQTAPAAPATGCHTYLGCFATTAAAPWYAAQTSFLQSGLASSLSPDACIHYCTILGYDFAGLRPDACECGDAGYDAAGQGTCDATCPGDLRQVCGGSQAISAWQTACEGQAQITQQELIALFRKVDDSNNDKIEAQELMDLFDGRNNGALLLRDCDGNEFPVREPSVDRPKRASHQLVTGAAL